jgi:hypothetical protein
LVGASAAVAAGERMLMLEQALRSTPAASRTIVLIILVFPPEVERGSRQTACAAR